MEGQSSNRVVVDIPFDFSVENTQLRAGNYKVEELQSGILVFNGNDGQDHQFALTVGEEASNQDNQPKLIFTRYGDETVLNKVFLSGGNDYRQLLAAGRRSSCENKLPARSFLFWSSRVINCGVAVLAASREPPFAVLVMRLLVRSNLKRCGRLPTSVARLRHPLRWQLHSCTTRSTFCLRRSKTVPTSLKVLYK